jgi:hypothetical protein
MVQIAINVAFQVAAHTLAPSFQVAWAIFGAKTFPV